MSESTPATGNACERRAVRPARRRLGAAWLAGLIVAAPAGACGAPPPQEPAESAQDLPRFDRGTSLLVVAPHPDDETLCCAGVIQRVLRSGGRASVVWLTSGDGSELDLLLEGSLFGRAGVQLGERRMQEARAATGRLGVPAEGQLFLGYPDGGLQSLLTDHLTMPYTSRFTGAATVPYPAALFPGHSYTGESLERDFSALLERVHPTLILAPSLRDTHPDHHAAGVLTLAVSARYGVLGSVRYWIVHGGEGWPGPRGLLQGVPLTAAPRSRGLALSVFALEPAEEDRMLQALRAYDSQMRTLGPFLLAFVRSTELFASSAGGE